MDHQTITYVFDLSSDIKSFFVALLCIAIVGRFIFGD